MALSLIIFDCDGVILESVDAKTRAFYRIGLAYGEEAADRLALYHNLHGGVNRITKFTWLFEEVLGRTPSEKELRDLNTQFVDYCYDEIRNCVMVPGVQEVLDTWHGKVPLYVASGAPHNELEIILKERGLAHYFTKIYGAPPHKTALLQQIIRETGISPEETVMIGDSQTDLTAAEAIHCHFYGRGSYFSSSPYPWYKDLTRLNTWLRTMAAE